MKIEILEEAQKELEEAVAYHEDVETGLGIRLKSEVRAALEWIVRNPELARLRATGYRRVNLRVFPYYVAYFIWRETIWVLAIAHSHRRPEYWIGRKRKVT